MAVLATQQVVKAGLNPAYAAAAGGGDRFTPGDRTFLHVKNGHSSSWTVTIATPRTDPGSGQAIADVAVVVPNAGERMIGPFPAPSFGAVADGLADITYTGVTALTVAVIDVPA